MLAFDLEDGAAARAALAAMRHVRFAPSLGDTATTVSYPVATSHRGLSSEAWAAVGISESTLRLSVGIDHVDDVWADLAQSFG
jgi:methionine-gamma-lyase